MKTSAASRHARSSLTAPASVDTAVGSDVFASATSLTAANNIIMFIPSLIIEKVCSLRTTTVDICRRSGGPKVCDLQEEDCLFFNVYRLLYKLMVVVYGGGVWTIVVVEGGGEGWWWTLTAVVVDGGGGGG
ncbi:hypothetical protein DM860_009891 [Cuscuta australis]|uniref:Uncharacterized protein n=1 Tax=Cuscuta australis TaxID=267555 RepID=A0A328DFW2_9ASTE|nr:hypothetical protein DM860_009891 [Cuscuta australis]